MAVPLNHKNHQSSRSGGGCISLEKYNTEEYKIVAKKYAITADGKTICRVGSLLEGTFRLPSSVEVVKSKCFKDTNITCLNLPSHTIEFERGAFGPRKSYRMEYKIKSIQHPFLGKVWKLTPKCIIIKDKVEEKKWLSSIMASNLPEAVKEFLTEEERILFSNYTSEIICPKLVDNFGNEYSEDGKTLKSYNCDCAGNILNDGIEVIADDAMRFLDIRSISIPASVKKLGFCTFCDSEIESITFNGTLEDAGTSVFDRCYNLKTIFVPENQVDYYKTIFEEYRNIEITNSYSSDPVGSFPTH